MPPAPPLPPVPLYRQVYRFFFYGWLFQDAFHGTEWERAVALRHNGQQARWLPTYLLRWVVLGAVLLALETLSERLTGSSPLSAALALMLIFAIIFSMVTFICWAFLSAGRPSR